MIIDFVEVSGFRGFRERTCFEFPAGFAVITGRNGAGKSTVLDAVDFALTGTINKFLVRSGFNPDEHVWWLGDEPGVDRYVKVGFVDQKGERFTITRGPRDTQAYPAEIIERLCRGATAETLIQTSLIRDELIVQLSVDLPGSHRFEAVRNAMGGMVGQDYAKRGKDILKAAETVKSNHASRLEALERELSRSLEALTEAQSVAERAPDISLALGSIRELNIDLPEEPSIREEALRRIVADRRSDLAQVQRALQSLEELHSERTRLSSPEEAAQYEKALHLGATAAANKQEAEKALDVALALQKAEQENDIYASQYLALLENGAALGLQDGSCPLCAAERTPEEFERAITAAHQRLDSRIDRVSTAREAVEKARDRLYSAEEMLVGAQAHIQDFEDRRHSVDDGLALVRQVFAECNFEADADNPRIARSAFLQQQEQIARLERALFILEASSAIDRVESIQSRVLELRKRVDVELANVAAAERAFESARQIEASTRTEANRISAEQFDTVMPLLKEFYTRLRPHTDWTEIESDFSGKVRASLNFTVAGGKDAKYLFSSGQRRALGLAFLLALHLSRRWCEWQTLLLDDPIQHIDDYRAVNLVEVLAAIRKTGRQIIIAVEDTALADVLCRRLRSSIDQPGRRFELEVSRNGSAKISGVENVFPMPLEVLPAAAS